MIGIFIESNTELGLLYNSYKDIPKITRKFMDFVGKTIDYAHKTGVPETDIKSELAKFKSETRMSMLRSDEVNPQTIPRVRSLVQATKNDVMSLLKKLGEMRKGFRFGDNLIKGIIIKPKIYTNSINDEDHVKVNSYMRDASNALDWIEKVIIDLMNLCDQDLNLLSLVKEVYYRKLYEDINIMSDDDPYYEEDLMSIDSNLGYDDFIERFNTLLTEATDEEDERRVRSSEQDLMGYQIKDQEFFPIFPIGISYDMKDPKASKYAKIIHNVTNGDEYTHDLLAFDTDLEHIVQFQMHGIERGNINTYEAVKHTKSIYVAVSFLTKKEISQIKKVIDEYEAIPKSTRYDAYNFISMMMGVPDRADKRHICSTFIGYLLNVANPKNVTKDYSEFRPGDVTILPRSFFVMTFKNFDDFKAKKEEFKRRVKKIYDDNIDDIREYNNSIPKVKLAANIKKSGGIREFFSKLMFGD